MEMNIIDSRKYLSYNETLEFFEKFKLSLFNHRSWNNIISKDEVNLTIPSGKPSSQHSTFYHITINFKNVDPLARKRKKELNTVLLNFTLTFDSTHSCGTFHKNVSNNSTLIIIRDGLLTLKNCQTFPLCIFDNRLGFVPRIRNPLTIEISIAMIEHFINYSKRFVRKRQQTWDVCGPLIDYPRRKSLYYYNYYKGKIYYNYNSQLPDLTNSIKIY